ncbi:MAG TPA: RraA family protein [Spirochaetales bacterium]|nr:RraA family protein [Spirochaetales bacterium]
MQIDQSQLEALTQFDGPTLCNAIEFFSYRPKTAGFFRPGIRKIFDTDTRSVGYACTAKISALHPPTEEQKRLQETYYRAVWETPKPAITVIQDIDPEPVGSFWGEVQATTHQYLGCKAVITSGGVRDLDEVHPLGFEYYASCILVSHAYVHVEAVQCPVSLGGVTVQPGDLVFADKHGIVLIPPELVPFLPDACRAAQDAELPVLQNARIRPAANLEGVENLSSWRKEMAKRREEATRRFTALVRKG